MTAGLWVLISLILTFVVIVATFFWVGRGHSLLGLTKENFEDTSDAIIFSLLVALASTLWPFTLPLFIIVLVAAWLRNKLIK